MIEDDSRQNVMTYTRIAAVLSTFLFLFFYGTGQAFCLCDQSDECTGIANELSQAINLASDKCCDDAQTTVTSTDDCCAKCQTTETTLSGMRVNGASDHDIQKQSVTGSPWIQTFKSIAHTSSAQSERPPPAPLRQSNIPIYIVYRSLLI